LEKQLQRAGTPHRGTIALAYHVCTASGHRRVVASLVLHCE
jgi:hypothetical protein